MIEDQKHLPHTKASLAGRPATCERPRRRLRLFRGAVEQTGAVARSVARSAKPLLVVLSVVATALMWSTSAQGLAARPNHRGHVGRHPRVVLVRIGHPAWVPVDLKLFTAPIGTSADGYAEFSASQQAVLPPPHYKPYAGLGIGPGTPEPPPYDHDISDGVEQAGYRQNGPFRPSQFSQGSAVYFSYMVVPTPESHNLGSSPDFARGRIVPNSLFPIQVTGATYRNGSVYDANLANFTVPALNDPSVVPPFNVDGHSHFPIFIADNSDFGPTGAQVPGRYAYRLTMKDQLGNGWSISTSFAVKPHC